jgi:hypothetical protein
MKPKIIFNVVDGFNSRFQRTLGLAVLLTGSLTVTGCGGGDAKMEVKKFCSQVKSGESLMDVVTRAGKVDFDKYWLEKYDNAPGKGDHLGIIRPRDLEKKTEKLTKLKHPTTWTHGQFKAMIQELGYSRHVCVVDFSKEKVLAKKVLSVD